MRKEELLNCIQESIRREESATTVYLGHLKALVLRSGLSESDIEEARKTVEFLVKSNMAHKKFMEDMLNRIEEDPKDVY
jgi:rubrerythrin